jgi:hypothetical protein
MGQRAASSSNIIKDHCSTTSGKATFFLLDIHMLLLHRSLIVVSEDDEAYSVFIGRWLNN